MNFNALNRHFEQREDDMPHTARKKGESGFYHVVTKGDGGQIIFESDENRAFYLIVLEAAVAAHAVELHAFCMMDNHVHLLVRDRGDALSTFMKQLDETYAMYYAKTTARVGHVFQKRYWSEPIETDERFLATLRYIHANPEPAGMCAAKDYQWSSYGAYAGKSKKLGFVTTDFALELLGGAGKFAAFQKSGGRFAEPFPGSTLRRHLTSDELVQIAADLIGRDELVNIRGMKPRDRAEMLGVLVNAGFTDGEIGRVTGMGKSSIHRELH